MATTKTATKKATVSENTLTGYCMKTKQTVEIQDPVISLKSGKYIAKGTDGNGNTVTTIMNETRAKDFISKGLAQAGEGLSAKKKK